MSAVHYSKFIFNADERLSSTLMTDLEKQVALLWMKVLELPAGTIEPNSNFLDLGGDSSAAAELRALLLGRYALDVPLSQLLESATVASISAQIEQSQKSRDRAAATTIEEGEL
jgi:acyl carrier protein